MNSSPSSVETPDSPERGRQRTRRPRIVPESGTDNTNNTNNNPPDPDSRRSYGAPPPTPRLLPHRDRSTIGLDPFPTSTPPPAGLGSDSDPRFDETFTDILAIHSRAANLATASRGTRSSPIPTEEEGEITASAARFLRDTDSPRPSVRGPGPGPATAQDQENQQYPWVSSGTGLPQPFPLPPPAPAAGSFGQISMPPGVKRLFQRISNSNVNSNANANDKQKEKGKPKKKRDIRAQKFVADLHERAEMAKEQRLIREGRDPYSVQIYINSCRENGYVLRQFMCRMSTTDGFDYGMGMKTLPACLVEDKECWRALDMWGGIVGPTKPQDQGQNMNGKRNGNRNGNRNGKRNFDVWVEEGYIRGAVLCVADGKNKCRGVVVRYRLPLDEEATSMKNVNEGERMDLCFDAMGVNRNKWKEGVLGLKVFDFLRPGLADKELQSALGDATRDTLDLADNVSVIQMHGGAGPSVSGDVEYPMDVRMRRYLDMEENVKRLAMRLGYEQVAEEQKPMGMRWVLEFHRDSLDRLRETLDDLMLEKADEDMANEEGRIHAFRRAALDDGKLVKHAGAVGGAEYLEDVKGDIDAVDDLMIIVAGSEEPEGYKTRNRDDGGYRPMPTMKLPVRNRELENDEYGSFGSLGKAMFSKPGNGSSSGSSNGSNGSSSSSNSKKPATNRRVMFYSAASPESNGTKSGGAILDSSSSSKKPATNRRGVMFYSAASPERDGTWSRGATLDSSSSNSESEEVKEETRLKLDQMGEYTFDGDDGHTSESQTPESKKSVLVENVKVVNTEEVVEGSSLLDDKKEDAGVTVESVDPSDEGPSSDEFSDDENGLELDGRIGENNRDDNLKAEEDDRDEKMDESDPPLIGNTGENNFLRYGMTDGANVGHALLDLLRGNRTSRPDNENEPKNDDMEVD